MEHISHNSYRLLSLFEHLRHHHRSPVFAELHALNLSPSHMRLLGLLACKQAMAMKDLADHLQLTPPSVTALTRRLVQTGLVQRETHADDSRVALVSLTTAGYDLHRRLFEEQLQRMEQLLSGLSPEEQELFLNLLERATGPLRKPADEPPCR